MHIIMQRLLQQLLIRHIETDDTQGGTNIVLDVANQPTKYQNKMLVIILGIGILAIAIITILTIKRKKDSEM